MPRLFDYLSAEEKRLVKKKTIPSFIQPMLAQLTHIYFSDPDWIFETKLDGERCLLFKKGSTIELKSRNDKSLNASYPEIVHQIKKLALPDMIIDGEIVAFKNKITNFSVLQARFGVTSEEKIKQSRIAVYYYVFDMIYCDGYDLTQLPLVTRKKLLKQIIPFKGRLRYVSHKRTKGELYRKKACQKGLEGVMAKKADSIYLFKRSSYWLKFKCSNEQEFVIGGYTQPGGSRINFGALLLGYYKGSQLYYAGKVGTGFDGTILEAVGKELAKRETNKNPFVNYDDSIKNVQWIKPTLVGQVKFTEWTKANKLRHPSFLGLRRDKSAKDVTKE